MCWFRVIIIFCSAVFLGVLITEEVMLQETRGQEIKFTRMLQIVPNKWCYLIAWHATKVWDIPMYENVK